MELHDGRKGVGDEKSCIIIVIACGRHTERCVSL